MDKRAVQERTGAGNPVRMASPSGKPSGMEIVHIGLNVLLILFVLALLGCGNRYYGGPITDHFNGTKFSNPWAPMPQRFGDFLKWRLTGKRGYWPESVPVTPTKPPARITEETLRVTYVGHATILLQTHGLNILTDPIWAGRASPISFAGPKRVAAPGVRFEDLPPIDVVLVSHNHYDHLNLATLERLYETFNPLVLTPVGNDTIIQTAIPKMRVVALDWGQGYSLNPKVRFVLEPMQHWSARGLFDRNEALWGAFVIVAPGGAIYFLADAGYAQNLSRDFVAKYGTPRFSLLPVAAYEPQWFMQYAHMSPAQAVDTFIDLGQSCAMGTQHEVFPMADESYESPRKALTEALTAKGISDRRFLLPAVGEWFTVPPLPAPPF